MSDQEIEISIDTLPDNDSFLPRFQTVQLLQILAQLCNTDSEKDVKLNNSNFVNGFKNPSLYTSLTFSIFWRENIKKTLEKELDTINETDKLSHAPITIAIANEDFALACELIDKGSALLVEDKLVLEIVLFSMLQRDKNVASNILTHIDTHAIWATEYINYLQNCIAGGDIEFRNQYHEVLNPPLRKFGQMLDTLTFFNGLPSHYGFLSQSLEILNEHLVSHVNELEESSYRSIFTAIHEGFTNSMQICKFVGNMPTNLQAANELHKKIIANLKSSSPKLTLLFGGFAGNAIAIAFVNNIFIYSNIGIGGDPASGTNIYSIKNVDNITEDRIQRIMFGLSHALNPKVLLDTIGDIVDQNPILVIPQEFNPIDNCIYANPRAIIQGIILVYHTLSNGEKITKANLDKYTLENNQIYTSYQSSLYDFSATSLIKFMRNGNIMQNKRVESCALAIDYINQHYQDANTISNCIDLKNALEYVGLKSFYIEKISREAKEAIQKVIINRQELAAIDVIKKENALIANAKRK